MYLIFFSYFFFNRKRISKVNQVNKELGDKLRPHLYVT